MKNIKLSLILPCFNEAEHFTKSCQQILATLEKTKLSYEIIFVEDNSNDQTKVLIKDFINDHNTIFISAIYHKYNQGRGKSVKDGIRQAKGKYIGFMDIDCEVSPSYINSFIKQLNTGSDLVYGIRKYQINASGLIRAITSKLYSVLVRVLFSSQVIDTEVGYKFFVGNKIKKLVKQSFANDWFWDTEISILAERNNWKIKGLSVNFIRRTNKTSTVNLFSDTIKYIYNLIRFKNRIEDKKSDNSIEKYWQQTSEAFTNQYLSILGFPLTPVGWFLKSRYKRIKNIIQNTKYTKMLDVGCGSGIFLKVAIEQNKQSIGIDYSQQMINLARRNLKTCNEKLYRLIKASATNIPLPNHCVDVILASGLTDYLTHNQTEIFFKEIKRLLMRKGIAVITFPINGSSYNWLRSGIGLKVRELLLKLPPIKSTYTLREINSLYKKSEMKIVNIEKVFNTMFIITGKKS